MSITSHGTSHGDDELFKHNIVLVSNFRQVTACQHAYMMIVSTDASNVGCTTVPWPVTQGQLKTRTLSVTY